MFYLLFWHPNVFTFPAHFTANKSLYGQEYLCNQRAILLGVRMGQFQTIRNIIMTQCLKAMGLTENTEFHVQCTIFFTCRFPTPETLPKHGLLGCLFETSREHQVTQASNQTNPVLCPDKTCFSSVSRAGL